MYVSNSVSSLANTEVLEACHCHSQDHTVVPKEIEKAIIKNLK